MGEPLQAASASSLLTRTTIRQWIERHEALAAAVALSLVLFTAYADIVFFGDSLVYSNNLRLLDYRISARTHGPDARPASSWDERNLQPTANFQDPGATWTQWETGGEFLERSLRHLELPFWDPYTGGGVPAMANLTQAFFFPPYLLLVALGNGVLLKNGYFLALLLTAGWCTWALLRRSGLGWSSSYFGGVAFMLSGGLTQTAGSFIGQAAACLPVALLITRWFLERSSWFAAAVLALAYASIALASFPPILLAVFGVCVAYVATELFVQPQWLKHSPAVIGARFAVGAGLGLCLVAFYYLPVFSLMNLTPQVTEFYRDAASQTIVHARDLLQLLVPALMGGAPIWLHDPVPRLSAGAFHYVGVVTLLTAGLVGASTLRKPIWFVALAGSVFVVGFMLGVPPLAQVRELPGLRNIHFGNYYGIVLDFLLALLAAAGLERLKEARLSTLRAWSAIALICLGVVGILLVATGWNISGHAGFADWRARYVVLVTFTFAAGTLVFGSIVSPPRPRVARFCRWGLLGLLVIEGVFNSRFPRQERWEAWNNPPVYVEYLQREAGRTRVFTLGSAMFANSGSAFGIIQLDSLMAFNPPRMFELYRRYARRQSLLFLRDADQVPPEAVLDAASVSYLVIPAGVDSANADLRSRGHELVFGDGGFNIFRRKGLPRYFFTSDYLVSSAEGALEALAVPGPERRIVVESAPPFVSRPNPPDNGWLRSDHFSNNYVRLSLFTSRTGFVYASESFFPGWEARVNGRVVPIEPANFAFRAVPVPAGAVTVEFSYTPPGLMSGLGVSVAGLLLCVGLLAFGGRA